MIVIGPERLHDLPRALELEWLETDGRGGYACGTVVGAHTRRYHAHLMAATHPPVGRRMLVAKLEESLRADGQTAELGCNRYGDTVHPRGDQCQESFVLDPWPIFTWQAGDFRLRKSLFMPHGLGVTVLRYELLAAPGPTWLNARPLVAGRDMHHLQRAQSDWHPGLETGPGWLELQPTDPPSRLALQFPGGDFRADGLWYYNFHYPVEQERGLDYIEDLYSPGLVSWLLRPGESAWLLLGQERLPGFSGEALLAAERERRLHLTADFAGDATATQLALAADQFLVQRPVGGSHCTSVIAGYPWFGDWGRDTMIALPGLTLATGRPELCRSALHAYVSHLRDGLIPNNFGEGGEASYNTADATLWLFVALRRYYDHTHDTAFLAELWPALQTSLEAHRNGTRGNIHCDTDGLLVAGEATTQLTWMDAKVGDWVVTPRHGKAVEINALWYNALRTGEFIADKLGEDDARRGWAKLARQVKMSFGQFWCAEQGYCYDCLRPEGPEAALRPNQLLAISLPYTLLEQARARQMLNVVTAQLLTPYGLRTLAPGSPGYAPHYGGDQWARDGAYHQGTVWPWLLGPYLDALLRVEGKTEATRQRARQVLHPLLSHLNQAGLGSISEIFDAEPPHRPQGCFAQAWSVAEVLRVWVEGKLGLLAGR